MSDKYNTKEFDGAVILKDWLRLPDRRHAIALVGKVTILQDKEIVGFESSKGEANWVARVDGPTMSYNILGCQVRGCVAGGVEILSDDYYLVP